MALTLSCSCGANFEVEDTFAGQQVSCPECQSSLKAPVRLRAPVRTSGLAIASLVLAVVGAFTVIGTLLAVLCGLLALVSIGRGRRQIAGVGLALLGILLGVGFTALSLFAYSQGELFGIGDQLRLVQLRGQVDYNSPLEIVEEGQGFKITRPSEKWGVARPELKQNLDNASALMLVHPGHDAYVDVSVLPLNGATLDQLRQTVLDEYRDQKLDLGKADNPGIQVHGLKVRDTRLLGAREGTEVVEVTLDVRIMGQALTYLIQIVRDPRSNRAYIVRSWTSRRRFAQIENELRTVVESFRVLGRR
jgi:hypothetical protein